MHAYARVYIYIYIYIYIHACQNGESYCSPPLELCCCNSRSTNYVQQIVKYGLPLCMYPAAANSVTVKLCSLHSKIRSSHSISGSLLRSPSPPLILATETFRQTRISPTNYCAPTSSRRSTETGSGSFRPCSRKCRCG